MERILSVCSDLWLLCAWSVYCSPLFSECYMQLAYGSLVDIKTLSFFSSVSSSLAVAYGICTLFYGQPGQYERLSDFSWSEPMLLGWSLPEYQMQCGIASSQKVPQMPVCICNILQFLGRGLA